MNIIYRIIYLISFLIVSNFVYKKYFLETDIQIHSPILNLVNKAIEKQAEIVYLGESSNTTYLEEDIDKRKISEFIAAYFPSIQFADITKEASHAGIYYELLRNIPENSSIKTVIVTMNLRSFNASWIYSNLETPLQKSIVLLKDNPPLFNRFLLSFKGYDIKTEKEREEQVKEQWKKSLVFSDNSPSSNVKEWDKKVFKEGIKNSDGSKNQALTDLACHYIKAYAFQIDTLQNPRIKDFDKIVELAKNRGWRLIFNLLAENTTKGNELVGKNLLYLMYQNRDLLIKRYNRNGVIVVDNLDKVDDAEFIDKNWTSEHYREKGRKIIANNIAFELKKYYTTAYTIHSREIMK